MNKYRMMTAPEAIEASGAHYQSVYNWAERLENTGVARRDESNEWRLSPLVVVILKARKGNRTPLRMSGSDALTAVTEWLGGATIQDIRQRTGIKADGLGLDALDLDEVKTFLSKWEIKEDDGENSSD